MVTNHLGILESLRRVRNVRLIALGGDYDAMYGSFVGMSCVDAVESPRVDITFVSAHGVSGGYAYHQDQPIIAGKLAMLACPDQKILLVDNSKLRRKALQQVCPLSSFDLVVVDEGASPASLRELEEANVHYELAR